MVHGQQNRTIVPYREHCKPVSRVRNPCFNGGRLCLVQSRTLSVWAYCPAAWYWSWRCSRNFNLKIKFRIILHGRAKEIRDRCRCCQGSRKLFPHRSKVILSSFRDFKNTLLKSITYDAKLTYLYVDLFLQGVPRIVTFLISKLCQICK